LLAGAWEPRGLSWADAEIIVLEGPLHLSAKGSLIGQGAVAPWSLPGSWFFPGSKRQHEGRKPPDRCVRRGRGPTLSAISAARFPGRESLRRGAV